MPIRIFISYRRDDSRGETLALHTKLAQKLPDAEIFMDADGGIPPGANFVRVIGDRVAAADVVLVVVGPRWVDAIDGEGRRRLDNPDDFVRIEVFSALRHDKRILPILLDATPMPSEAQVPDLIRLFTSKQAMRLRYDRFDADVDGIAKAIHSVVAKPTTGSSMAPRRGMSRGLAAAGMAAALAIGIASGPATTEKLGLSSLLGTTDAKVREIEAKYSGQLALERDKTKREHDRAERAFADRNAFRDQLAKATTDHKDVTEKLKREAEGQTKVATGPLQRELDTARGQVKTATERAAKAEGELKDREQRLAAAVQEADKAKKELAAARQKGEPVRKDADKDLDATRAAAAAAKTQLLAHLLDAWSKPSSGTANCNNGIDHLAIIRACTELLRKDDKNPTALFNRGAAFLYIAEYDLSILDFEKRIALPPTDAHAYWNRGLAYELMGDKARAIQDFTESLKAAPDAATYARRARLHLELNRPGDRDKAIADFRTVVASDKFEAKDRDAARAKLKEFGAAP